MDPQNQFSDPAADILRSDPNLDDNTRADLHDAFHAKSASELESHLMPLENVSADTKHQLWTAKKASEPQPTHAAKLATIGSAMQGIDSKTLDLMESHPTVFKALASALIVPPKGSTGGSKRTSAAGKGKTAKKPSTTP